MHAVLIDGSNNTKISGNLAIQNTSPWVQLNIGSCGSLSDGYINFGKNNGGSYRNCRVGFNSNFWFFNW